MTKHTREEQKQDQYHEKQEKTNIQENRRENGIIIKKGVKENSWRGG